MPKTERKTEHFRDITKGLDVTIERGYASDSDWYQTILDNTRWYRVKYKSNRFGKDCETPCWTTFFGGIPDYQPYTPVPVWLQPLVDQVTNDLGVPFNAFLLRLYFDGDDEIAWHTDGRTFLGPKPVIASLSFGATAHFQMRRMTNVWPTVGGTDKRCTDGIDRSTPQRDFCVQHGDMLVMRGETQKYWHHRVPRQRGRQPRVNINFRYILPGADAERGQKTYYKYMVHGDQTQPPSFSYAEIMAKRGGIMSFLTPKITRNIEKEEKGEVLIGHGIAEETATTRKTRIISMSKTDKEPAKIIGSHPDPRKDCAAYLASDPYVDQETFLSLPTNVQSEIIDDWKRHRSKRTIAKSHTSGQKSKKSKSNHTLHSYFRSKN